MSGLGFIEPMTSSNTLKKIVSVGAAMLFAIGGNLVAAEPALAATSITWDAGAGATMDATTQQTYVQSVTTGSPIATAPSATKAGCVVEQWQEWRSGIMFSNVSFPYSPYGATLDLRPRWSCPNTLTTAPTAVLSGNLITVTPGVWATTPDFGEWKMCGLSVAAGSNSNGYFNNNAGGCDALYTSAMGMSRVTSTTVDLTSTFYQSGGVVASLTGKKLVWVEFGSGSGVPSYFANTAGIAISGITPAPAQSSVSARPLSAEQARNTLKPVPAAVQPLVPGFLALNKPMASLGGKVALSAGDFTGLISAKIAGKSLDFILGNTGKITMTVPQGEAGKTADLVLTFNTGSIILQDAIKYVAPLDIAKVGVRPISIAAGAKKISDGVADQIRQAAFANAKNDTIQCIAYSASNSSAAIAAAKLTAVQACGVAVKANPDLKVADVAVIVDKLKARTQGVGIKVYKATN
jgi:hypothetical protein